MEINKIISAAILLTISIVVIVLFVMPAFKESSDLQGAIVQKETDYVNKSMYFEGISREFASIETRRDVLSKIESAFPQNSSLASIIYFVQQKGTESGVAVKSLVFSDLASSNSSKGPGAKNAQAKNASKFKSIAFNIELIGTYQGLKSFLASLENSARLFEVDAISFGSKKTLKSVAGANTQLKIYNFTLQIKTYTY